MVRFGGVLCGALALVMVAGAHGVETRGPVELQVDNLSTPLGIDDATPKFSWKLKDDRLGARQTAYEVQVGESSSALIHGKVLWDSGRVASNKSINVHYAGEALQPSTRYYWRVKVWDAAGKAYKVSEISWWETGLLHQDAWKAGWIGFETPEEDAVRHAKAEWITFPDEKALDKEGALQRTDYRAHVELSKAVSRATLYATCQDTVSAWVNGHQTLAAQPLLPSGMMPWKKYVKADVGASLETGANTLAVECVHYGEAGRGDATPVSATLYVEYKDGSHVTFVSGTGWKTAVHAANGWQARSYDDAAWKTAVKWLGSTEAAVRAAGHPWIPDSVKALRNTFTVSKKIESARLYSTALGAYEVFLNGWRVGNDVLAPGWTDYRERVEYQTYDVTALLTKGKNAIGALLAPGWYSTVLEWFGRPNNYGDTPPALRAQLRIEYSDGSVEWVNTGSNWKADQSYIVSAEWYDGETQDARRERPGWDKAVFDGATWKSAQLIAPAPVRIEAQAFPPIRVERTMTPVGMTEPKPGVFVYDFGQNMGAVEQVRLDGPAGTKVKLRFAEIVNDDGTLFVDNLRAAKATDYFILAGKGPEEFTPQFTTHGFRYIEITGLKAAPAKEEVKALVLHTAATFTSKLTTGSAMVNKLWSNILWSQRSNFISVPVDCPQRDERLGWMMDAQVFWRTASTNMDLAAFSRKFAADMRGTQATTPYYGVYSPGTATSDAASGAGWSDAGVIIPWTAWLQTGDTTVIAENWDAMEKFLAAIAEKNPDGIWKNETGTPYGDWLAPDGASDISFLATAYWAYDVTRMAQMAHALGRTADEQKYQAQFEKIKAAFIKRFVHSDGLVASAAKENEAAQKKGGDTQTGYVLALHMNLLPENLRAVAAKRLVEKIAENNHVLGTGFLGTPYLLEELTKAGYADVAYELLLTTKAPSWGYMVTHGATTIWEHWDSDNIKSFAGMNSYNHYGFGAVAEYLYRYAAGVDTTPLDAGYHTVILHPVFSAQLGSIAFDYDSSYGVIHSDWKMNGASAAWNVKLPANTTGWISAQDAEHLQLNGTALEQSKLAEARELGGRAGFEIPAGSYAFVAQVAAK